MKQADATKRHVRCQAWLSTVASVVGVRRMLAAACHVRHRHGNDPDSYLCVFRHIEPWFNGQRRAPRLLRASHAC